MNQNTLGILSTCFLSLVCFVGWKINAAIPAIDEISFVKGRIEKIWVLGLHGGSSGFRIENQSFRGPGFLKDKLVRGDFVEVGIASPELRELYKTVYILKQGGHEFVSFDHEVRVRKSLSNVLGWASATFFVLTIVWGAYAYQVRAKATP